MLEIDGVRAALSVSPAILRAEMDRLADDYMRAIDWATDPAKTHLALRQTFVLANVHMLRCHADLIIPALQEQETTPGLAGVTEAYCSTLNQLEGIFETEGTP